MQETEEKIKTKQTRFSEKIGIETKKPEKVREKVLPLMILFVCLTVYDSRVRRGAFGLAMEMQKR